MALSRSSTYGFTSCHPKNTYSEPAECAPLGPAVTLHLAAPLGQQRTVAEEIVPPEPAVRHAISQTMIGEYLHKYPERADRKGFTRKRRRRFVWIHPFTKVVLWSPVDPSVVQMPPSTGAKCAHIIDFASFAEPTPREGSLRYSFIITTTRQKMKFVASSKARHDIWVSALNFLVRGPQQTIRRSPEHVRGSPSVSHSPETSPSTYNPYRTSFSNSPEFPALSSSASPSAFLSWPPPQPLSTPHIYSGQRSPSMENTSSSPTNFGVKPLQVGRRSNISSNVENPGTTEAHSLETWPTHSPHSQTNHHFHSDLGQSRPGPSTLGLSSRMGAFSLHPSEPYSPGYGKFKPLSSWGHSASESSPEPNSQDSLQQSQPCWTDQSSRLPRDSRIDVSAQDCLRAQSQSPWEDRRSRDDWQVITETWDRGDDYLRLGPDTLGLSLKQLEKRPDPLRVSPPERNYIESGYTSAGFRSVSPIERFSAR